MKTVQEDPKEFFAEGGWDFLGGGGDVVSAGHVI
jgi:nucleosome binding factor SPN SPT16 subunit